MTIVPEEGLTLAEMRLIKKYESRSMRRYYYDTRDFKDIFIRAKNQPITYTISDVEGNSLVLRKIVGIKSKRNQQSLLSTSTGELIEAEYGYRRDWETIQPGDYTDENGKRYAKQVIDPFVGGDIVSKLLFDTITVCRQKTNMSWDNVPKLIAEMIASSVIQCCPKISVGDLLESYFSPSEPDSFFSRTIAANRIPLSTEYVSISTSRYSPLDEKFLGEIFEAIVSRVESLGNILRRSEYSDIINSYEMSISIREIVLRFLRSRRASGAEEEAR